MTQTFNEFGLPDSSHDRSNDKRDQHKDATKKFHEEIHQNIEAEKENYDRYGTVYKINKHTSKVDHGDDYDRYGTVYKFNRHEAKMDRSDDYDRYGTVYKFHVKENDKDAKQNEVPKEHLSKKALPKGEIGKDGSIHFAGILGSVAAGVEGFHARIIRDGEHRVKEIDYPNGKSRKFAYDKSGSLNQFTDVDGISHKLDAESGKWVDAPRSMFSLFRPEIIDAKITADGKFTYQTAAINNTFNTDGSATIVHSKENATVQLDRNGRTTEIKYGTGKNIDFEYANGQNQLSRVHDSNGNSWSLKDSKWIQQDGTESGISRMTVSPSGTLSITNAEGLTTSYDPDLSKTVEQPNRTSLKTDTNGNLVEIFHNDQKSLSTKFKYFDRDDREGIHHKGDLQQIIAPDGQYLQMGNDGHWLDRNGADTGVHDLQINTSDGSYRYLDAGNHVVSCGTDGQRTTTKATLEQIQDAAIAIHDEENHTAFTQPFANGDRVNEIIQNLDSTDRIVLQSEYERGYGKKLTADLTSHLNTDDSTRANENLYLSNLENDATKFIPSSNHNEREQFIDNMHAFLVRAHEHGMTADEISRTFASTQRLLEANGGKVSQQEREQLAQQIMAQAAHPEQIAQGQNNTCNVTDVEIRTWATHPAVMANMVANVALDGSYTTRDGKVIVIPPSNFIPERESIGNLPSDGSRSFASQLIQAALINDVGQRESTPKYFSYVPQTKDKNEDSYWTDAIGNPVRGNDGKWMHFAGISFEDIGKEAERITGVQQTMFVHREVSNGDGLVTFGSEDELRDELDRARRDGRLPIIIGVSPGDPMFGGKYPQGDESKDKEGKSNRKQGGHVVCIDDYDLNTGLVQLDNSWSSHKDKVISVHELYEITN